MDSKLGMNVNLGKILENKQNIILFYSIFFILNYAPSSLSGTSLFACKICFIS